MATSIQCGFQALAESSRACLLALVDQPQISADVMNKLIEAYEATKAPIVIPTYDGQNGHPILIDVGLKKQILAMDQEQGLRQVVQQHFDSVRRVPMSSRVVLEDCDFPQDYDRILKS
jgi:molybdenum cofactor cytidylyltransferase